MKKLSRLIEKIPEDMKYYWKPNELQKRRKDQGWIHLSDLRKVLKGLDKQLGFLISYLLKHSVVIYDPT